MRLTELRRDLRIHAEHEQAAVRQRFFKTGPGEYGEGDRFLGVRVPAIRRVARRYGELQPRQIASLLKSKWHEERLVALLVMVDQFSRGDEVCRAALFDLYRARSSSVNNWDLVDSSAHQILGGYLKNRDRGLLYELAGSPVLWERRMAIIATLTFIKESDFDDCLALSASLFDDPEDLIHKASGWMLREVGKRDPAVLEAFLDSNVDRMPRTMLRYAIEKMDEGKRHEYLAVAPQARTTRVEG